MTIFAAVPGEVVPLPGLPRRVRSVRRLPAAGRPGPTTHIEAPQAGAPPPPPNYIISPGAASPQLRLEQRVQRPKDMCDKGLFTPEKCAARRQELLNQM